MKKFNPIKIGGGAVILAIIVLTHISHSFNSDEGVVLDGAWNLYNHRHLYSDFFAFIPPASFYLIFWLWKLVGVSFWSAKILSIIMAGSAALGLYLGAREVKTSRGNIAAPFIFALACGGLILINHNFYNLVVLIWAVYFFLLALREKRWWYYGLSGLFSGIAILFLQQKGLVLSGVLFLYLFIFSFQKWRSWLAYGLSAIVPLLVLLAWPLKLVYYNLVTFPLFNYIEVNRINPSRLYIALAAVLLLVAFLRRSRDSKVWLILVLSFFSILAAAPLPDQYHIIIAATPLLFLTGPVIEKIRAEKRLMAQVFYVYITAIFLLLFLSFPILYLTLNYYPSVYRNKDIRLDLVSACPGKYLYAGPFIPFVYFETGKISATKYPFLVTGHNTAEQFTEAVQELKTNQPSCAILIYPESLRRFKHDPNNVVETYIREHYEPIYSDVISTVYTKK